MNCARLVTAFIALVSLTACDGGQGLIPTRPGPPAAVPEETITGEIRIASISPQPGATVPVRPCAPGSAQVCADSPLVTLDVVIDLDIPDASLTVSFGGCGLATTPVTSFTAGNRMSLTTSVIQLSDDGPFHDGIGAALRCELPAVTPRIFVSLWRSGQPARPLLTREFAIAYTFGLQ